MGVVQQVLVPRPHVLPPLAGVVTGGFGGIEGGLDALLLMHPLPGSSDPILVSGFHSSRLGRGRALAAAMSSAAMSYPSTESMTREPFEAL